MGLMVGVELVKDRMTKESAPDLRDRVVQSAFQNGLLLLGCGESTIRFCPPLIIGEAEVDTGLSIFEKVVREIAG
jgi:4-aminobutyrate aminotransferase